MINFKQIKQTLTYIHNDEQGAQGAEKVLIIAAIVLPLLAILLFFKQAIVEWLKVQWDSIHNNTNTDTGNDPNF